MKKIMFTLTLLIVCVFSSFGQDYEIEKGKFEPTDASLEQSEFPDWYIDGKFGIWAHWGPQAVPRQGDWYARNMYVSNEWNNHTKKSTGKPHRNYTHHVEHYGHPSKFGFKDIFPLWKAERFDPEDLMKLYKKAGAKFFVSMATHHDNFFLWDSQIHKWTSTKMGPMRDIVGDFQAAAKKEGLKFGVSEHLGASYFWWQTSKGADKSGPYAGVPYDTNDPEYADLYHKKAIKEDMSWLTPNKEFQARWYECIKELVDMYHPDLLYSDSGLPFGDVGRNLLAHYYNGSVNRDGAQNVVYTCKEKSRGRFIHDYELGVSPGIQEHPWQIDISVAGWFFDENQTYKPSQELIYLLIDVVSKNGLLLLNVVQTPEGDLEQEQILILEELGEWMDDNGEAIYASRPWSVYGQGPSISKSYEKGEFAGIKPITEFTAGDLRFTRSKDGKKLYVFMMSDPKGDITIGSLNTNNKVKSVRVLDSGKKVKFSQAANGALTIKNPQMTKGSPVTVLEVKL